MSQSVVETLRRMEEHKEARRAEYVETGPVAQGHCDGYREGVQDSRLLIEAEGEHPAVALLRRWESAYRNYVVISNGSMGAGVLINDTAKFLREVDG